MCTCDLSDRQLERLSDGQMTVHWRETVFGNEKNRLPIILISQRVEHVVAFVSCLSAEISARLLLVFLQKNHFKCRVGGKEWAGIDCSVFDDPHPMTMALSVLVTIEMLNALNRFVIATPVILVTHARSLVVYQKINRSWKCHPGQINIFCTPLRCQCHYTWWSSTFLCST